MLSPEELYKRLQMVVKQLAAEGAELHPTPLVACEFQERTLYFKEDHKAAIRWAGQKATTLSDPIHLQLGGNKSRKNLAVFKAFKTALENPGIQTILVCPQGAVTSNYILLFANDIIKCLETSQIEIAGQKTILFCPFYHDRNPHYFPFDLKKGNIKKTGELLAQFSSSQVSLSFRTEGHVFEDEGALQAAKKAFIQEQAGEGVAVLDLPGGGSTSENCVAYALCLLELLQQLLGQSELTESSLRETGLSCITPTGSAGTHSGLLAGAQLLSHLCGIQCRVIGISNRADREDAEKKVTALANSILSVIESLDMSLASEPMQESVVIDSYRSKDETGVRYSALDPINLDACRQWQEQGVYLDAVYGAPMARYLLENSANLDVGPVVVMQTGGTTFIDEAEERQIEIYEVSKSL